MWKENNEMAPKREGLRLEKTPESKRGFSLSKDLEESICGS